MEDVNTNKGTADDENTAMLSTTNSTLPGEKSVFSLPDLKLVVYSGGESDDEMNLTESDSKGHREKRACVESNVPSLFINTICSELHDINDIKSGILSTGSCDKSEEMLDSVVMNEDNATTFINGTNMEAEPHEITMNVDQELPENNLRSDNSLAITRGKEKLNVEVVHENNAANCSQNETVVTVTESSDITTMNVDSVMPENDFQNENQNKLKSKENSNYTVINENSASYYLQEANVKTGSFEITMSVDQISPENEFEKKFENDNNQEKLENKEKTNSTFLNEKNALHCFHGSNLEIETEPREVIMNFHQTLSENKFHNENNHVITTETKEKLNSTNTNKDDATNCEETVVTENDVDEIAMNVVKILPENEIQNEQNQVMPDNNDENKCIGDLNDDDDSFCDMSDLAFVANIVAVTPPVFKLKTKATHDDFSNSDGMFARASKLLGIQLVEAESEDSSGTEDSSESSTEESSSSSTTSSDSSDGEDIASIRRKIMEHAENEGINPNPPKTLDEVLPQELPAEPELEIELPIDAKLEVLGEIQSYVEQMIVIKTGKDKPALDVETTFFLENKKPIGKVFDVFGPVENPFYVIRLDKEEKFKNMGMEIGTVVYFVPNYLDMTKYVFVEQLKRMKGSDASWQHDQEPPPECVEYSDDEEEAKVKSAAKKRRQNERKQSALNDAEHDADNEDNVEKMLQKEKRRQKGNFDNRKARNETDVAIRAIRSPNPGKMESHAAKGRGVHAGFHARLRFGPRDSNAHPFGRGAPRFDARIPNGRNFTRFRPMFAPHEAPNDIRNVSMNNPPPENNGFFGPLDNGQRQDLSHFRSERLQTYQRPFLRPRCDIRGPLPGTSGELRPGYRFPPVNLSSDLAFDPTVPPPRFDPSVPPPVLPRNFPPPNWRPPP